MTRQSDSRSHIQFTVDAALLRELGERLIGRAHIALGELVKNAFDADAHTCRVDIENDRIVVADDGHGISQAEFHDYWMRIGTTHKAEARHSRNLRRPMTGSKGLGRLSVQFLADKMELKSNSEEDPGAMLYAYVDWGAIRDGEDLQTVDVEWDHTLKRGRYADGSSTGTRITLTGLRTRWDAAAIQNLGKDIWLLRSPFRAGAGKGKTALDFDVDFNAPHIEGAKTHFDKLRDALFNNWKARIIGSLEDGRRGKGSRATVSVEFAPDYPAGAPDGGVYQETLTFPIVRTAARRAKAEATSDVTNRTRPATKPELNMARYEILVFKPEGRQPGGLSVGEMREYLRTYGGVSVYDAGFRLPYYGSQDLSGHDWLEVGVDQGRRLVASELLPERLRIAGRYLLDLPNPGRIFGAVHVDTNHEQRIAQLVSWPRDCLRIQPGRDRLAPNKSFEQLRDLVRLGLDFYANRYRAVADDALQKQRAKERPEKAVSGALATVERYKAEVPKPVYREVKRELQNARKAVRIETQAIDSRAALLAPLATAGMAALAMNHELANDATLLQDLSDMLRRLAAEADLSSKAEQAIDLLDDYRARLDVYQRLFFPLADPEERSATRRLPVQAVVRHVVQALRPRLAGVTFRTGAIPRDLRFPVGAFAEWSAILQNLLFNAWNAMLDAKRRVVRFSGSAADARRQYLRVSDTGAGLTMPLEEADRLFEAFERRLEIREANRSIAIGGQGLGLAIVRLIAHSRGADAKFVRAPAPFSTAIEISWRS